MTTWIVYVCYGYEYEYETEIEAPTVFAARKLWKKREDWKTVNFKVSKK